MLKTKKLRAAGSHRSADSKGLPPGWIRVESRSKPGVYFYAHPATKRTQTQHPGERHVKSKIAEGPRRRKSEAEAEEPGPSPLDVEDFEDPTEKAERLRQEAEEAEAAEAARQDMVRQQRAAKRALLKEADKEKQEDESGGSEDEKELVSKEELAKWKEDEERREREEAEAERQRKAEEERRIKEEERRRQEEERRREEEERRIEAERIALWKARTEMARKEAEFEWAMSRERQKKEESDKKQLEAERVRQALLERKKSESEEEKKKAEAELRKKAEAERLKREAEGLRREAEAKNLQNQHIEEPSDHIDVPGFDVFKSGERIGRFPLSPGKSSWIIGRCPPVDIQTGHETVSRKHAQVTRQGCFTFLQDLGSAHGTVLNGQKLVKNTLERLCSGDNLRFGGSSRIYVYREPSTAIQINRGLRPVQITIEQDVPQPQLESPKHAPALPGKPAAPAQTLATQSPPVTKLTRDHSPPARVEPESPVQVQANVVSDRAPAFESDVVASNADLPQQRQVPQSEGEKCEKQEVPPQPELQAKKPQKEGRKSKKSSSSSSSTSSSQRKKKKRKSSKSSSRRKKSSSSSSTSSKGKKRKESSKRKKRKSSSTSASTQKRKKRKSRSKRKSSSS